MNQDSDMSMLRYFMYFILIVLNEWNKVFYVLEFTSFPLSQMETRRMNYRPYISCDSTIYYTVISTSALRIVLYLSQNDIVIGYTISYVKFLLSFLKQNLQLHLITVGNVMSTLVKMN